jgi:hypothetical protein
MRMMGVDSVEYHEHTVAGRGDDPVIAAAAYYASRGETPMVWGGRGRCLLLGAVPRSSVVRRPEEDASNLRCGCHPDG